MKNRMIISYSTFARVANKFKYFYKVKTKKYRLVLIPDRYARDNVGYVIYRGHYVATVTI